MQPPAHRRKRPWIIAHRGARVEAPENTAAAFSRALGCCVDGVETDVQMSADGVPVLFHDRTLKKIGGPRRPVADLTWEELRRLDAGSWFSPAFSSEPLLRLEKMLDLLAGRTRLFIEIKVFGADRRSGRAAALTEKVVAALRDRRGGGFRRSCRILSFDPEVLRHVRRIAPALELVLDLTKADARRLGRTAPEQMDRLDAICIPCGGISAGKVNWAHGLKKQVFGYTCNDEAMLHKMLAAGVDAILTDDPARLAAEMKRRLR